MGLRHLYPESDRWVRIGDLVDNLCCTTQDLWNEPSWRDVWNYKVMVDEIIRRFWCDVWMYNAQQARRVQRIAYATSNIYAFLRIYLPERVVDIIQSFV